MSNSVFTGKRKGQIGEQLAAIVQKNIARRIRASVGPAVDEEISKLLFYTSLQMQGRSNFKFLSPYLPYNYAPLGKKYAQQKQESLGHSRFFSNTGELAEELSSTDKLAFLSIIGNTRVSVARGKQEVTVRIAPNIRLKTMFLEQQLSGALSEDALRKLGKTGRYGGLQKSYRPVIGPMFLYFRQVRIPAIVKKALKKEFAR